MSTEAPAAANTAAANPGKLAQQLLELHPAQYHKSWIVSGLRVTVRSNMLRLLARLRDYYGALAESVGPNCTALEGGNQELGQLEVVVLETATQPIVAGARPFSRDSRKQAKEVFLDGVGGRWVQKLTTGLTGILTANRCVLAGPCERNLNQLINAINAQCLAHYQDRGWLLCHAAAVSPSDSSKALVLLGAGGAGKSTLLLHLLEAGYRFVSNDRVLLGPGGSGELRGVAKWPRVNPGTLLRHKRLGALLPADELGALRRLTRRELRTLEDKHDVPLIASFGPAVLAPQPVSLGGSVLLSWDWECSEPTRVEPLRSERQSYLASVVARAPGALNPHGLRGALAPPASAYVERMRAAPVLELSGGVDFARAVAACLHELKH